MPTVLTSGALVVAARRVTAEVVAVPLSAEKSDRRRDEFREAGISTQENGTAPGSVVTQTFGREGQLRLSRPAAERDRMA